MDYLHSFKKDNKVEKIDANKANTLINNKQYDEAIAYITQYSSSDAKERERMIACVNSLKLAKAKEAALAKSLTPQQMSAFNFADMILTPGATDLVRYKKDLSGHDVYNSDEEFIKENPAIAKFREAKKAIGSEFTYDVNNSKVDFTKVATMVQITIPKHKEGLLGADLLYKDNNHKDDILNTVYNMTGQNPQDLIRKGVKFEETNNGDFKLYFDKNTDEGIALMIAIGKTAAQYTREDNLPIVQGFDVDGNKISNKYMTSAYFQNQYNIQHPYFSNDVPMLTSTAQNNAAALRDLAAAYDEVQDIKKSIIANRTNEDMLQNMSSTVFAIPGLQTNEAKTTFIDNMKGNLHYSDRDYYGYLSDENGDNLIPFTEANFREFRRLMVGRSANQIHIQGMTVNGITGILITLDPKLDQNGNVQVNSRPAKMFIPNYAKEYTDYAVNTSTDLQATMYVNNMKNYGVNYDYTFDDGSRAYIDGTGAVRRITTDGQEFIDDSFDSQHNLARAINKDLIIQQADMHISQYLNADGTFNMKSVKNDAMGIAFAAAEELYPEIPLVKTDGTQITIGDIFNPDSGLHDNMEQTCSRPVVEKIDEIFDVFNTIIGKATHK